MARQVVNGCVDVTDASQAVTNSYLAQHQSLFPGNVIAEWTLNGRRYFKVPYVPAETPPGMNVNTFRAMFIDDWGWDGGAPDSVADEVVDGGSV